ncbi:unnamed protein product [Musa acuminata var. zebrina]
MEVNLCYERPVIAMVIVPYKINFLAEVLYNGVCFLVTCRYDYSEYGASTVEIIYHAFLYGVYPSEYNTYADIETVYQCLQTEYGAGQEDLILYGQSVGSGPTLHLAAHLPRL